MTDLHGISRRCAMTLAASAVLVTGCGDSSDSGNATDAAPLRTPHEQLLLTEQEFPAGAEKDNVSVERLLEATADIPEAFPGITITPPECERIQRDIGELGRDLLAESVLIGTTDEQSGAVYTETIARREVDLAQLSAGNQTCSDVTTTSATDGVTYRSSVEALTIPAALHGIDVVIYRATSARTSGTGESETESDLSGHAVLRGVTVSLHVSNWRAAPDEASFTELFTAAVEKVRKAA